MKLFESLNMIVKRSVCLIIFGLLYLTGCNTQSKLELNLNHQNWIHGSQDCNTNTDPPIQIMRLNEDTWILRQNKCKHYEAPFMFLFFGNDKCLLVDTGALEDETTFPLYQTVRKIIDERTKETGSSYSLTVAHTHSHSDHHAADIQFLGKPGTSTVGLEMSDIIQFFQIKEWPENNALYDLGDRALVILPSPGHHKTAISIYDSRTKILLTGDTFYPGRLYVDDWVAYKKTIDRLVLFAQNNEVDYLLGNHIEISTTKGVDYITGSTYQPNEQSLSLSVDDLLILKHTLDSMGNNPVGKTLDKFIIYPE